MKGFTCAGLAMVLCSIVGTLPATVSAAEQGGTESRPIDPRVVRVRLDGIVALKLRQGPNAGLVLSGDPRWVGKTVTEQRGDTLFIDTVAKEIKITSRDLGVQAELTLPQLREVVSNSLGWTEIAGFSGDRLELVLDGAGSMKVICSYRTVSASLGGLGSMNIQAALADGLDLNLHGAGYVTLSGHARWLRANLGGLGGLDAQQFQVDSADVDLSGLGNAAVFARQQVGLNLNGLGSVTVFGKPAGRNAAISGLGKVTWK